MLEEESKQKADGELSWEKTEPGNRTDSPIPVLQRSWLGCQQGLTTENIKHEQNF